MTALLKQQCHDLICSSCENPIPQTAHHFEIDFDIRRIQDGTIEVLRSEKVTAFCVKCSLEMDLKRLDAPNKEGWYVDEPLGYALTEEWQCSHCQKTLPNGGKFQAASIRPVGLRSNDTPTITISLCPYCAGKRILRHAFPPSNACPPYCYQCGTYTGYTGGYSDHRKFYVAHPSVKPYTLPDDRVRVCGECIFEEPEVNN